MVCANARKRLPTGAQLPTLLASLLLMIASPVRAGPPAMVALDCPEGTRRMIRSMQRPRADGHVGLPYAAREVVCVDEKEVPSGPALQLRSAYLVKNRRLLKDQRFVRRDLVRMGGYVDGRRHGRWTQVDSNGEVLGVNRIDHGKGTWRIWHANGQEGAAGLLRDDLREGDWHIRYRSGERAAIGGYRLGKRHGAWRFWHSDGSLDNVSSWRNDERFGLETRWFLNGEKRSEGDWAGDRRDGDWWFFNQQGQLLGRNRLDRGSGHWIDWHDNGQKQREGELVAGQRDGPWTRWHDNGQKAASGMYARGVMTHKTWTYWNRDSKPATAGKRAGLLSRLGALSGLGRGLGRPTLSGTGGGFVSRSLVQNGRGQVATSQATWRGPSGRMRHTMIIYRPPPSVDLTGAGLSGARDAIMRCGQAWIQRQSASPSAAATASKLKLKSARFRLQVRAGGAAKAIVHSAAIALDKDWHVCVKAALDQLRPAVSGPSSTAQVDATVVMR